MRPVRGAGIEDLLAVAGLGHHFHPGFVGEQHPQALARHRLVVGDHQFQAHASRGNVTSQA